ncbi:helix-turn-helix domain-containing protein [Lacrimispora sp.]|uniref:helix-turn-helix domain-containing protein n=1 Tax=Lacrimispora sp. TaxID=2719234 RepID=UPI003FA5D488
MMKYRITKSCDMLRETNRTVCNIAITCGFQSPSYFSYIFRSETEYLPKITVSKLQYLDTLI